MTSIDTHGQEMAEHISKLRSALNSLQDARDDSMHIADSWRQRITEIEAIKEKGWRVHRGGGQLVDGDIKALQSLLEVARHNESTYSERASKAVSSIDEIQQRLFELDSAHSQFTAHKLMVSSGVTPPFDNGATPQLMKSSRESAYKARALIEIGAGLQ